MRCLPILIVFAAAPLLSSGAVGLEVQPLAGSIWSVVKVQGVPAPAGATLAFEVERVTGHSGCNAFWAPVDYSNPPAIDIGAPQSKRLYCAGAMSFERAYLAALETVESFAIEGDTLKMMMHDGDVFLELRAKTSGD
ncbi:MAG: META domain-containing protein [Hyphomicrobium sp.]|nr:META domain-containing protein [Hyphomicrobium sp.]